MLGTLITSINVATLLAGTVAVFGSMNPTGANAAPSGIDNSVQLLVLWQPLPLWTIMQAGTGKCSPLCGVSVVLLASRTLPKFLMLLSLYVSQVATESFLDEIDNLKVVQRKATKLFWVWKSYSMTSD